MNYKSFEKSMEKELINDVEIGIEEEIKDNQKTIIKFIVNLFKKIIGFFFLKLK